MSEVLVIVGVEENDQYLKLFIFISDVTLVPKAD
jgi:hypothetical protein